MSLRISDKKLNAMARKDYLYNLHIALRNVKLALEQVKEKA